MAPRLPVEASEERNLLNGQHGGLGTVAVMWACPGYFALSGVLGDNELVYALQLTAQHYEETF